MSSLEKATEIIQELQEASFRANGTGAPAHTIAQVLYDQRLLARDKKLENVNEDWIRTEDELREVINTSPSTVVIDRHRDIWAVGIARKKFTHVDLRPGYANRLPVYTIGSAGDVFEAFDTLVRQEQTQ